MPGRTPEPERFWPKVDASGDCWQWTATTTTEVTPYGLFRVGYAREGTRTMKLAHRWAWERLVGPIPDGKQMDHMCYNTLCVNPDHLRVVSQRENAKASRRNGPVPGRKREGVHHRQG